MKRKTKRITEKALSVIAEPHTATDPYGSYTGKPENENEIPVQDVDDL